jgi:hypothetical protein
MLGKLSLSGPEEAAIISCVTQMQSSAAPAPVGGQEGEKQHFPWNTSHWLWIQCDSTQGLGGVEQALPSSLLHHPRRVRGASPGGGRALLPCVSLTLAGQQRVNASSA